MSESWMIIQDAATALGISTRTIERRIKDSQLESRLRDDGRREVLVDIGPTEADKMSDTVSVVKEQAEKQLQIASAAVGMSKQLSDHLTSEVKVARRSSRLGWSLVAVLVITVMAGGWWGTRTITETEGNLAVEKIRSGHLADQLDQVQADKHMLTDKLTDTQGQLRDATDRVEGLERARAEANAKPTFSSWLADAYRRSQ